MSSYVICPPEEYGDYFAWGETSAKLDYSWATSVSRFVLFAGRVEGMYSVFL